MAVHSVGGRSAATAATTDHVGAALWNPAAAKRILVVEIAWAKITATVDNQQIIRTSTRGTQTLTATPDLDNDWDRALVNSAAAVLDLTYSAQPTVQGPPLMRWNLPAAVGSGFIKSFVYPGYSGIVVPPGTGLAVSTPSGVVMQAADVTFTFVD